MKHHPSNDGRHSFPGHDDHHGHHGQHDRHDHHGRFGFAGLARLFSGHRGGDAFAIGPQRGGHPGGGHRGRGGFGGFGDFGDGEGGMPRGRKFSSDDLQLLLIALLAEEPRHGYELIKALQVRSNGFYSPSPGMVYPALTYLEELGYATVELEGNRKRYSLAETGRAYLAANQERADLMLAMLTHFARKMDSVRRAFAGDEAGERGGRGERGDPRGDRSGGDRGGDGGADSSDDNQWLPEFVDARRALKRALLLRSDASVTEQQRIAAILARATADIEKDKDL